ncbi:hypothetical protein Hanom_Chr01g00040901 [Helianthus anomalus]
MFLEDSCSYNLVSSLYDDLRVFPRSFKLESSFISSFLSKPNKNLEGIKLTLKIMFLILGNIRNVKRFLLILGICHKLETNNKWVLNKIKLEVYIYVCVAVNVCIYMIEVVI